MLPHTLAAVYPGDVDGILRPTVRLAQVSIAEVSGSSGRSWTAKIVLSGSRKE